MRGLGGNASFSRIEEREMLRLCGVAKEIYIRLESVEQLEEHRAKSSRNVAGTKAWSRRVLAVRAAGKVRGSEQAGRRASGHARAHRQTCRGSAVVIETCGRDVCGCV